jgi:ribosome modulation factor
MADQDSLDQAQKDGYQAYFDGLKRDDNPYDNDDEWDLNRAWLEGYSDAALDD